MTASTLYPPDLWPDVVERWKALTKRNNAVADVRLPQKEQAIQMFDVAYQSSLRSEEGRPLRFRLVFATPEDIRGTTPERSSCRCVVFDKRRPLSVAEVVRLAPALDHDQSLIGVAMTDGSPRLSIWGLVDAGLAWIENRRGEKQDLQTSSPPPTGFTVVSTQRGSIIACLGPFILSVLHGGRVLRPAGYVFAKGPVADYIDRIRSDFQTDLQSILAFDDEHVSGSAYQSAERSTGVFLNRILTRIHDGGHGGSIVIVPDEWEADDSRVTDRMTIKYVLNDTSTWQLLLDCEVSRHRCSGMSDFVRDTKIKRFDKDRLIKIQAQRDRADADGERVRDRVNFIASLANVDGAVVITDRMRIIGFGAEITVSSSTTREVLVTQDALGKTGSKRSIDDFGTRHRSAIRLCSSHEGVCALVVSQDGDVRAVLRVGPNVVMWQTFGVGRTTADAPPPAEPV